LLALQDRFSEAWTLLNSLEHPGFVNADTKHISELYLLAYLAMSHPDDSVLAAVPSIMGALRSRCLRPEWVCRINVLQEQLSEAFEGRVRPAAASDVTRMRSRTDTTAQIDVFAFAVKVRNEAKTFVDIIASGLQSPTTACIKIFQLDIEAIFSKDPFLVAGRDNNIAAGSMFAAVVPHVLIQEVLDPAAESDAHGTGGKRRKVDDVSESAAVSDTRSSVCRSVELPLSQSSSCFFLSVECNGINSSQTVFKR
jgi:hypothetical protein